MNPQQEKIVVLDENMEQVAPTAPSAEDLTGVEPNRVTAALSYLGILVLIPLFFTDKKDPFITFHAKQGLVIFLGLILALVLNGFLSIIGNILGLILMIATVAGLIQALQGKWWKVPLVGDIADRFKI